MFSKLLSKIFNLITTHLKYLLPWTIEFHLLDAQEADAASQFSLAKIYFKKNNFIEAYAWSDVACYLGYNKAKALKETAWNSIPSKNKEAAQDLAREYRKKFSLRY